MKLIEICSFNFDGECYSMLYSVEESCAEDFCNDFDTFKESMNRAEILRDDFVPTNNDEIIMSAFSYGGRTLERMMNAFLISYPKYVGKIEECTVKRLYTDILKDF